jgi:hypothetical protein
MKANLSKPQLVLLREIVEQERTVVSYYPPARSLVAAGLAEWTGKYATTLSATEKGRAKLLASSSAAAPGEGGNDVR